jgi:hypothetical protein
MHSRAAAVVPALAASLISVTNPKYMVVAVGW